MQNSELHQRAQVKLNEGMVIPFQRHWYIPLHTLVVVRAL